MTTVDFITELFCRVDDRMPAQPKHPQARLYPSELVTIGLLFAIKGVGNRAFYRWLTRDYRGLFPNLPERTRLFRALEAHASWTDAFLATPTRIRSGGETATHFETLLERQIFDFPKLRMYHPS